MIKTNLIITGIILGTLLTGSALAYAQNGTYTIYPSYMHGQNKSWIILSAATGETAKDFITLENLTGETQKVSLQIREAENADGKFTPDENEKFKNLGRWVKLPQTAYELAPHEKIRVPVEITIPSQTQQREYTGVIYAVQEQLNGDSLKIVTRIGVRLYITVKAPNVLQTNIFGSATYKSSFFFIFSLIALLASIAYQIICWHARHAHRHAPCAYKNPRV